MKCPFVTSVPDDTIADHPRTTLRESLGYTSIYMTEQALTLKEELGCLCAVVPIVLNVFLPKENNSHIIFDELLFLG